MSKHSKYATCIIYKKYIMCFLFMFTFNQEVIKKRPSISRLITNLPKSMEMIGRQRTVSPTTPTPASTYTTSTPSSAVNLAKVEMTKRVNRQLKPSKMP